MNNRKKKLSLRTRNALIGYSFILPNFIGFFIFVFIPVMFSLVLSLVSWNGFGPMKFVGLKNFVTIFKDKNFVNALSRTMYYTFFTVVLTTFIALGLAVLLNNKLRFRGFFRSAVFFPYVASIVAVGVVWNMLFQKDFGPINEFLRWIGIQNPPGWTASVKWAIPAVIIVSVWKYMGYYMIVLLAALQDIPVDLYEAATIDGANRRQYFWRIAAPLLTPALFFVVLMLTVTSFKSFDLIYVMTEGGPGQATTLVVNYIYSKSFISETYGVSSAAAMVLLFIISIITLIQFHAEKKLTN
ncbi:carbohydrate ABC transporter permease [Lachnoclostridium phytofermentans]|uniref:Binding-protein-dependent transport systems inner membrane component n=1 Tax=Lachnoclostridium phytofermentans (strain ATCC 700394 / DSM 18823 / ISDg) TaxID=357809 RepID=A9KS46_LACP7|nr:sugar ABC transporter permease [Lachnoclostridium phytofermentans]ABX40677.1 binding-protein-dependent transport systems inner membrane component [Lachnoclostridium phytofermentans ISDg]